MWVIDIELIRCFSSKYIRDLSSKNMSTYETVLEYLYAKEMVEGIEHAHAVMHELDADEIQYIVEEKVKDKQDVQTKVDPSKAKRLNMMKRQILQKKVQAVRQGAGADVTASYEPEGEMVEGVGDAVKAGVKRHKDAVEKKKIKNRKAVPYAALAAQTELEGDDLQERCTAKKPSELAKKKKLSDILAKKDALKEMWGKKKTEKKPQKAMDAGARAKRKLQRREYASKVSGSEDNVPENIRDDYQQTVQKVLDSRRKEREEKARKPATTKKIGDEVPMAAKLTNPIEAK